jgi:hypothetical protein
MASGSGTVAVWCHSCGEHREASVDTVTGELNCRHCHSDCVEQENQNIDEFVGRLSPRADRSADVRQQLMNRVIDVRDSSQSRTTVIHNGQPVNIVVRQMGPVQLSGAVPAAPSAPHLSADGIFGLLASLSSIRDISQQRARPEPDSDEQVNSAWEDFLHYILMNETSHAGAPPATKSLLEGLTRVPITTETDISKLGECYITQDPFEAGDVMVVLPCGHNYKQDPIVHWLGMHNTCPVCRVAVTAGGATT